jgi:Tripartite tricarboxylate transporter family receptor
MTHVPYKLHTALIADLLSGVLDIGFDFPSQTRSHIEAGRLTAVAMASDERMKNFPTVPTFAELGHPDMKIAAWSSFLVPVGTPQPIVEKLDAAIAATVRDPVMTEYYSIGDSIVLDIGPQAVPGISGGRDRADEGAGRALRRDGRLRHEHLDKPGRFHVDVRCRSHVPAEPSANRRAWVWRACRGCETQDYDV